jgi:cation-transporting ATPase E
MSETLEAYRRAIIGIGPIIFRHVFVLVNAVIFSVVALLFVFGDIQAGIFLGVIIVFNILLGIGQDFRARVSLEKLQLLTALRVIRVSEDGAEESVLAEEVGKHEHIKLKLGDQVPCDGIVLSSKGLEVSEALITGESDSFPKKNGDKVLAGYIITAGGGTMLTETTFAESRMAKIAADIRKYSINPSPIQIAINTVITYTGYILIAVLMFVIVRGVLVHDPYILIVKNVGALASTIVPQGLVVVTTLLFAFGAASYSRRKVLFQEINATEKLGRIKNLCMDKTGTLTENKLMVEQLHVPPHVLHREAEDLMLAYIQGSGDVSQMVNAVKAYVRREYHGALGEALPFSSWRQYGVVQLGEGGKDGAVFVGSPDIFLPHVINRMEREWLAQTVEEHSHEGKRLLCITRTKESLLPRDLSDTRLSVAGVFAFHSGLREGIQDAVKFFQDRGVRIRIITGDNADTARAVATAAGVYNAGAVITGAQMKAWSPDDFKEKTKQYTVFARIVPEQKEKIIEALKQDGFTAMIGDGANDALAIKKADLGIAMFDGAPATRQLAAVVLMNNNFIALPGGVRLADNFIRNIEIFASIFLNQIAVGIFFFVILSFFGYAYPLTPLNVTLTNYFTVGLPGLVITYWAIRPTGNVSPASTEPFLKRVLPFPIAASIIQAIGIATVFFASPAYLKAAGSNTLVLFAFAILGFVFFALTPSVYGSVLTRGKKVTLALLGIMETILLYAVLNVPILSTFFDVGYPHPPAWSVITTIGICFIFSYGLYICKKRIFTARAR